MERKQGSQHIQIRVSADTPRQSTFSKLFKTTAGSLCFALHTEHRPRQDRTVVNAVAKQPFLRWAFCKAEAKERLMVRPEASLCGHTHLNFSHNETQLLREDDVEAEEWKPSLALFCVG